MAEARGRRVRAEHLAGDALRDDHPPGVEHELTQLVPVEAQAVFAGRPVSNVNRRG